MKIVTLTAENIKRIVAVEITPDGNMVQITGRNGEGKTSVLDSIWWALGGATVIQEDPIRHGQQRASIKLDLGELIVHRTFNRTDGDPPYTTRLTVSTADGRRFAAAQTTVLDTMLNAISFDPLLFAHSKPAEQYDMLREFVPAVDFLAIDRADTKDFEERRDINTAARQARAVAAEIATKIPTDLPEEAPDEATIAAEMTGAARNATSLARLRRARARREEELRLATDAVASLDADEQAELKAQQDGFDETQRAITQTIQELEAELAAANGRLREHIAGRDAEQQKLLDQLAARRAKHERIATEIRAELDEEAPIPADPDVEEIAKRLAAARVINEGIRTRSEWQAHVTRAEELEAKAKALTDQMDKRQLEKEEAIAAAGMPIAGLSLKHGMVLLDDVPFNQASDAQRLRTSIAIAMAANPKLRVIRVRDGSLLDTNGMKLLAEMAEAKDCQVWIERVADDGDEGFVIEAGQIKSTPAGRAMDPPQFLRRRAPPPGEDNPGWSAPGPEEGGDKQ